MNTNYTLKDLYMPESIQSFLQSHVVTNLKSKNWCLVSKDNGEVGTSYSISMEGEEDVRPCAWLYSIPSDKQTLVLVSRQHVYVLSRTKYSEYVPKDEDQWSPASLSMLGIEAFDE